MKILLLMPLDEKYSFLSGSIYNALDADKKDITFAMPQFMDYLVGTKIAPNFEWALFDCILSAEKIYETAEKEKKDLIIIGNMPKKYQFDIVFNCQDEFEDMPYVDNFVEKMKDKVKTEDILVQKLDLHTADESKLTLHNTLATAEFLSHYVQTDPHIEEIKKIYTDKLKELAKKYSNTYGKNNESE